MALPFINFAALPDQKSALDTLWEDALKGYTMARAPKQMAQKEQEQELANQLKQLDVEHRPQEYALSDQGKRLANALQSEALKRLPKKYQMEEELNQARINKLREQRQNSATPLRPTGELGNWVYAHPNATQEEITQKADELYSLYSQAKNTSAARANKLTETQDLRSATQQGKLLQEAKDVSEGYVPGTNRTQQFSNPQQQQYYQNQYDLKLLKERSDSVTRNRAIYAGLVDNTFNNINTDKLVQYGGIAGEINKRLAQGKLVSEADQRKYRQYKEEVAKVGVLAKQIRQFYGDSISPSNLQKLEKISNPSSWSEYPEAAKAQFEAFKKIVTQETNIYRNSLKSIKPFEEEIEKTKENPVFNLATGEYE